MIKAEFKSCSFDQLFFNVNLPFSSSLAKGQTYIEACSSLVDLATLVGDPSFKTPFERRITEQDPLQALVGDFLKSFSA